MKIINILLCILIFILAALSAASSYFLYEKREQMLKGWDKMAQSVNATAKVLDKDAGTTIATTLSPEALGHVNYSDLDNKLPALQKQAEAVVKQRDDLVKSIRKIAGIMESDKSGSNADFQDLKKYTGSSNKLVRDITNIKERQDDCFDRVAKTAGRIGVRISADNLKSAEYGSYISKIDSKLKAINSRKNVFDNWMARIAKKVGVKDNVRGSKYNSILPKVYRGVETMKGKLVSTASRLKAANSKIEKSNSIVGRKDKYIASLNSKVKTKEKEINRLKKIISGDDNTTIIPDPWADGGKLVRSATKGSVVEVSRKFGFVVVDLGSSASVKQRIGKKINYVNPQVKTGDQFVVIRNLDSGSPKFIGKIKLVKVDENCAIANIVAGSTSGSDIKVGDSVVFASTI
jgi:hypothetical protein